MRITTFTYICGAVLAGCGALLGGLVTSLGADAERGADRIHAQLQVASAAAAILATEFADQDNQEHRARKRLTNLTGQGSIRTAALLDLNGNSLVPRLVLGPALHALPPLDAMAASLLRGGAPVYADGIALAPIRDQQARLQYVIGLISTSTETGASWRTLLLWWTTLICALLGGKVAVRAVGRSLQRIHALAARGHSAASGSGSGIGPGASSLAALESHVSTMVHRLQNQRYEIEDGVQKRTNQLEAQGRQKDEFLANTVHELRTPLTTVLASLEILREGFATSPQDQAEFIEQATVACRHLMFIVNDLLDTAALEAGKLQLAPVPCFTREILEDAERLLKPVALSRDMELRVELPEGDPRVLGDRNRIMQVIFNLVGNAMKFSPRDAAIVLRCSVTPLGAAFEIEDSGFGVPLQTRSKLFTRFGRAHSADEKASSVGGTGIGLYLCKSLVEQMRGSIGYRDRAPEAGSVFWFTLPLVRNNVTATQAAGAIRTTP